jgi:hypothetical protein
MTALNFQTAFKSDIMVLANPMTANAMMANPMMAKPNTQVHQPPIAASPHRSSCGYPSISMQTRLPRRNLAKSYSHHWPVSTQSDPMQWMINDAGQTRPLFWLLEILATARLDDTPKRLQSQNCHRKKWSVVVRLLPSEL